MVKLSNYKYEVGTSVSYFEKRTYSKNIHIKKQRFAFKLKLSLGERSGKIDACNMLIFWQFHHC